MQMERLPCVLRIHGGPVASETIPGGTISPLSTLRGWLETAWSIRRKQGRREGPQTSELIRRLSAAKATCLLANFGPTGVAMMPACRKLSLPLVVHFHGYDAHRRDIREFHTKSYLDLGQQAAAVIAVSNGMVDTLVAAGIPTEKIHLVRYGVDSKRFQHGPVESSTLPRFFGLGRFVDKKAPYLTVLAFAQACKEFPDAKLVMAGNGELLEATKNLAIALKLGDAVEFPGVLSPDEVATQMRQATAFVQHSLEPSCGPAEGDREGTPVAVLEAMMTGIPVISTRHAGIGEVVEHQRSGLLSDERDVMSMAANMVTLGRDAQLTQRYGKAAREAALAHHTVDHYIDSLKSVLESIL